MTEDSFDDNLHFIIIVLPEGECQPRRVHRYVVRYYLMAQFNFLLCRVNLYTNKPRDFLRDFSSDFILENFLSSKGPSRSLSRVEVRFALHLQVHLGGKKWKAEWDAVRRLQNCKWIDWHWRTSKDQRSNLYVGHEKVTSVPFFPFGIYSLLLHFHDRTVV